MLNEKLLNFAEPTGSKLNWTPQRSSPRDRRRILIVEDEGDSASLLQIFLTNEGYHAKIALDGSKGIALARQFSPDAIISDIHLTGTIDGYTLATTIRNDAKLNSVYLIALSGFGEPEDKKRAKAAGFDAHLTKPLNIEAVQKAIVQGIG